ERAPAALEAALRMERAVQGRAWPEGVEVRLRTGLHSGRPTLTDAGYVGLAVNTVARICAAAHGGQILLSEAARDAARRGRPRPRRGRARRRAVPWAWRAPAPRPARGRPPLPDAGPRSRVGVPAPPERGRRDHGALRRLRGKSAPPGWRWSPPPCGSRRGACRGWTPRGTSRCCGRS